MTDPKAAKPPDRAVVPSAEWAEAELLGACLVGPTTVAKLAGRLSPDDFFRDRYRCIFRAMTDLAGRGDLPVFSAVVAELDRAGQLAAVGGPAFVAGLATKVPSASETFVNFYAEKIRETKVRRRLIGAAETIARTAADGTLGAADILRNSSLAVGNVARESGLAEALGPMDLALLAHQMVERRVANGDERALSFGLIDLDDATAGGARPGQLVVVGGRPGMGKTALLRDFARAFASRVPVLFASNEMTAEQLAERDLAAYSGVHLPDIMRGRYTPDQLAALTDAAGLIGDVEIINHVDGAMTTASLRAYVADLRTRTTVGAIVVDYLQRMADPAERSIDRVGKAVRGLKQLALELDVPVIVGSQLSRQNEHDADKRPGLVALRETGEIEQEADVVFLIHRESYYYATDTEWRAAGRAKDGAKWEPTVAEIIIAKQRQGVAGASKRVLWVPPLATFRNLARGMFP